MITSLKIAALKGKARKHYRTYYAELGRYDYGAALAEQINPRLLSTKVEFNKIMDERQKIDPACPAERL